MGWDSSQMATIRQGKTGDDMRTDNKSINVNPCAEAAVMDLLLDLFGAVAYFDRETLLENFILGCDGGMSEEDRSISTELAGYLTDHFAFIFMGLIVNRDFLDAFMGAVTVEISLMNKDRGFVSKIRQEVNEGVVYPPAEKYVVDFSRFDEESYRRFETRLYMSFDRFEEYYSVFDELAPELTDDDIMDIGFCISNFMYLIRAFSGNGLFVDYVKSVIETVQETLGI